MKPLNWKSKERWKPIKGYEGIYSVSNMGRIKRHWHRRAGVPNKRKYKTTPKLLKVNANKSHSHPKVKLRTLEGVTKSFDVKYLVADAWLKPRRGGRVVYKSDDVFDCSVYNLKEIGVVKEKNAAKLTIEQVKEIKQTLLDSLNIRGVKARIAKQYDISPATITRISKSERWEEIEPFLPLD